MIKDIVLGLLIFSFLGASPPPKDIQNPLPPQTFEVIKTQKDIELDRQYEAEQARLRAVEQARIDAKAKADKEAREKIESLKPPVATPEVAPSGSCRDWIIQAGVTDVENAYWLIMKESGCSPTISNPSSGAFGIPQALPASKIAYCGVDPVCQIKWMQEYVVSRYGSWSGAVAHSQSNGWY